MKGLVCFVLMQFVWSFGQGAQQGAGSFAYSDSSGRKYSGTYGLKDGQPVHTSGDPIDSVPFARAGFPPFGYGYGFDDGFQGFDFYPTYFSNLENTLQEAFQSNIRNQQLAFNAARQPFDLSSNQAGYFPNFPTRFPQPAPFKDYSTSRFGGFPGYPGYQGFPDFQRFQMPNYQSFPNVAAAGASLGGGYKNQFAYINPANPASPNVNVGGVSRYSDTAGQSGRPGYYSVESSAFSSSSNVNGKEVNQRGANTRVNDNGKVTEYKVHS